MPVYPSGLSQIHPTPHCPTTVGEEFSARLRGHPRDRWYRMRWHGWSRTTIGAALVETLEPGPRAFDVLEEMRP